MGNNCNGRKKTWILLLFLIPKNIIFSFGDIISKILLTNKLVLPQNLMFYKGIYNFGMHIIIFFILFYFNKLDFEYFSDNLILKITRIIINIILLFSKLFCIMKIIYLFTPFHVAFVNLVVYLYNFIYHILFKNYVCNKIILIIIILGLIIVIFGTLLFNEIIILNACGLNLNTKHDILIREKKDNIDLDSTDFNDNSLIPNTTVDEVDNSDIKDYDSDNV